MGKPGDGDRNIQTYRFRLCLTKNPTGRIPVLKPAGFDRAPYEIYFRTAPPGSQLPMAKTASESDGGETRAYQDQARRFGHLPPNSA